MSEKYDFFDAIHLLRFEFAFPSLAWGLTIGSLLGLHKYRNSRNLLDSIKFAASSGLLTFTCMWGYNLYKFTMSQHVVRQQSYARQEAAMKAKFIEEYFRSRYGMEEFSHEQFSIAINDLESSWRKLEDELVEEDEDKNN